MQKHLKITKSLEPVISDITDWPIYKLSQDRASFLGEAIDKTIDIVLEKYNDSEALHSELKNVLYQEKNRLTKEPWKSDRSMNQVNLEAQTNTTKALFETFGMKTGLQEALFGNGLLIIIKLEE